MRAVLEAVGVKNVLAKAVGSRNPINLVRATDQGPEAMQSPAAIAAKRGKTSRRSGQPWLKQPATIKVRLSRACAAARPNHRLSVKALGLQQDQRRARAQGQPVRARPDQHRCTTWSGSSSKPDRTKENEHAHEYPQARRGRPQGTHARRPRHRFGPGQDRRPWPQGPATPAPARARSSRASKAARCRCSVACPRSASARKIKRDTAEVLLYQLEKLDAARSISRHCAPQAGAHQRQARQDRQERRADQEVRDQGRAATAGASAAIDAAGGTRRSKRVSQTAQVS